MKIAEDKAGLLPVPASHYDWLMQRTKGIGGSDASTIMGLNTYESAYSLWAQKTGRIPVDVERDPVSEELMLWGHLLEPIVLAQTSERLGLEIMKPDQGLYNLERPFIRANLDGWSADGRICEFKTTNERNRREWLGGVPDHAYLQTHHAALVTGASEAIVSGLVGGQKLVIHEFGINQNVLEILLESELEFWNYVETDTPPPLDGHIRTLEVLNSAWESRPGAIQVEEADVSEVWEEYQLAHEAEKAAKKQKDYAKARLLALLEGHEHLVTGGRTWASMRGGQLAEAKLIESHPEEVAPFLKEVKKLDREAFRAKHPELFKEFQGRSLSVKGEG